MAANRHLVQTIQRGCELMNLPHSTYYYKPKKQPLDETELTCRIEAIIEEFPGYGYRRVPRELHRQGIPTNHKKVLRIMRQRGLTRKPRKGIIHHSDQGVQYAAHDYVDTLLEYGFQISMARKGNPYDNATAESFMKTLKTEEICLWEYRTLADVQLRLPYFIEQVYNHKRLHSSLGYLPPMEFEELFRKTHKPCPTALTQAV